MPIPDQEAREELRYGLRRYLAARPTAALTLDMIRHGLQAKGLRAEDDSLMEELTYWEGLAEPQVKTVRPHKHSTLKAYQITSAGVMADALGE